MSHPTAQSPAFLTGQTLLLLPSLKSALEKWPALPRRLAHASLYAMHAEALPQQLGYGLSVAAIKLAGVSENLRLDLLTRARFACADFAQLRVEIYGVRAIAIGNIALTNEQDEQATALLMDCLEDTGIVLHRICPGQYVLELPDSIPSPVALAPSQLIGSALSGQLPEPSRWRQLLNESQMLLAQTPLGFANSLWFYGAELPNPAGKVPLPIKLATATNDPLLLGLQALSPPGSQPALHIFDWRAVSDTARGIPSQSVWISCDSGELFFAGRFDALKFWRKKRGFTSKRAHANE